MFHCWVECTFVLEMARSWRTASVAHLWLCVVVPSWREREREMERKRTSWVIWTWLQLPDLSEPLLMGQCLNKMEYPWFSYKPQLQEQEVIASSVLCWSQPHVHPGRVVPWPGCVVLHRDHLSGLGCFSHPSQPRREAGLLSLAPCSQKVALEQPARRR